MWYKSLERWYYYINWMLFEIVKLARQTSVSLSVYSVFFFKIPHRAITQTQDSGGTWRNSEAFFTHSWYAYIDIVIRHNFEIKKKLFNIFELGVFLYMLRVRVFSFIYCYRCQWWMKEEEKKIDKKLLAPLVFLCKTFCLIWHRCLAGKVSIWFP